MARKSYTFPDDVTLDANGTFGIERAEGGWVAFNDGQDIGLGAPRLWTSTPFATDSEAQMVRVHAARLAKQKQEEAHLRLVSAMGMTDGNRSYTMDELVQAARDAVTGKVCERPELRSKGVAGDGSCGGALTLARWGVRVHPAGAAIIGVARCATCAQPSGFQNAL